MSLSRRDLHQDYVDRKYRAKVIIIMVIGCLSLWGAVGFFALHAL